MSMVCCLVRSTSGLRYRLLQANSRCWSKQLHSLSVESCELSLYSCTTAHNSSVFTAVLAETRRCRIVLSRGLCFGWKCSE